MKAASHLAAPLLAVALLACDVPRDADGTLDRVRGHVMRVGVVNAPPWAVDSAGAISGVEPALVTALARELGAQVQWVRRPEAELMTALHDRELDLVIGGLTGDMPWAKEVAFSRSYYTDTVVVGVPAGTVMREVRGETIAIEDGDPVAAELRKRNAMPVIAPGLGRARGAVAAPMWRLAALGRVNSGIVLQQQKHVMAAAPGENAWLVRVERSLRTREREVPRLLRQVAP
jgi:polar amino acid transport system substrate-binding protein